MKTNFIFATIALFMSYSSNAMPPFMDKPLSEKTVKVSDHVSAIIGFPNIGIIVGQDAVLVVDTGLGRTNGETVAKVVKKLAPHHRIYLTTTHFHPEHASGILGFPKETILIRNRIQQDEMDAHGEEMIKMFSNFNALNKSLLKGEQLRGPDEVFDKQLTLNLGGGVTTDLYWFGAAHTKGDELIFVNPDKTLISGDVVQNKVGPHIFQEGGTPSSWIAAIEQVENLGPLHVLPDHSPIADGSVVGEQKAFLTDLRSRSLELKKSGKTAEEAGKVLTEEVRKKYPDWNIDDLTGFVKGAYSE